MREDSKNRWMFKKQSKQAKCQEKKEKEDLPLLKRALTHRHIDWRLHGKALKSDYS